MTRFLYINKRKRVLVLM